jgi:hypothetical protein
MSRRQLTAVIVATAALLFSLVAPAVAADADPDPLAILSGRGLPESVGLGVDTITVNICGSTDASHNTETFTMTEIVDWANAEVAPHFALISGGRYTAVFTAGQEFQVAPFNDLIDDRACMDGSLDRTSTSNAMVMTRSAAGGGFGGPGRIAFRGSDIEDVSVGDLSVPARDSRRGFLIRGGSYLLPAITAHELGHTLHWPHSGSTLNNTPTDYDNQMDLMSGGGWNPGTEWNNGCSVGPGVTSGACEIVHTPAINRYAAGWIDAARIEMVMRPGVSLDLQGPEVLSGTAMALVPTADPNRYLTIDARPATGYDSVLAYAGVTVHEVDLGFDCSSPIPCFGADRRQQPAVPAIDTNAHVVPLGGSLTVAGVTISVTEATSGGYRVDFSGVPEGCALGLSPFTDLPSSSFAYDSVGCIRLLGITTGTSPTNYSPDQDVTREQMAAFIGRLWRALGQTCASPATPFTDVASSSFAFGDVACIFDLGVTTGVTATAYGPDGSVTREQMAAFLGRLWRALGNECSSEPAPFTDVAASSFAFADVACIFHLDITTGTSATTYDPSANVSREQMAAFIERFWRAAISA